MTKNLIPRFLVLVSMSLLTALAIAEPEKNEIGKGKQGEEKQVKDERFDLVSHDYDKYTGDEINQVCAGCHGEFGIGGKEGKYPRLAGLPVSYLIKEIVQFRERKRPNIAMVEHVEERQLPNNEVMDIALYLNKIKLATRLPKIDETAPDFDAYARLKDAEKIIQIGKAEGDIKAGEKLYRRECKSCHGKQGEGDEEDATPMLAGQYTTYLFKQIDYYIEGKRLHDVDDPEEEFLKSFSQEELRNILAYISILDD